MSTAFRPSRRGAASGVLIAVAIAGLTTGCGGRPPERDESASPPEAATSPPAVQADTSRDGAAFVAIYGSGPIDELRVVRATDGALVAGGSTSFPDGTRITISLLRDGPRGREAMTTSRATVELGHFMSGPLVPLSGPVPQGMYTIRLTVPFGETDQTPEVRRAADSGRRFAGPGAQTAPDGRIVHETTMKAPL